MYPQNAYNTGGTGYNPNLRQSNYVSNVYSVPQNYSYSYPNRIIHSVGNRKNNNIILTSITLGFLVFICIVSIFLFVFIASGSSSLDLNNLVSNDSNSRLTSQKQGSDKNNTRKELNDEEIVEKVLPAVWTVKFYIEGGDLTGSGFFISEDGLFLTNDHVACGLRLTSKAIIRDYKGKEYKVKGFVGSPIEDVAVLIVDTENEKVPYLNLASPEAIKLMTDIYAVGAGKRYENTITSGKITGLNRFVSTGIDEDCYTNRLIYRSIPDAIQISAAINPGNSGGPVVNKYGEVVGIAFAIGEGEAVNFMIPINRIIRFVNAYEQNRGMLYLPYLGVAVRPLTKDMLRSAELPENLEGVNYIDKIDPRSAFYKVGIRTGSIILQVGSKTPNYLYDTITEYYDKDAEIEIVYIRPNSQAPIEASVKLEYEVFGVLED